MDRPITMERFAWQYAFCARLVHLKAPATAEQLQGLAEAAYVTNKHRDPTAVADVAWKNWPSV